MSSNQSMGSNKLQGKQNAKKKAKDKNSGVAIFSNKTTGKKSSGGFEMSGLSNNDSRGMSSDGFSKGKFNVLINFKVAEISLFPNFQG